MAPFVLILDSHAISDWTLTPLEQVASFQLPQNCELIIQQDFTTERGEGQLLLLWMECKQTDSPKYRFQFWAALAGWLSQHSERRSHGSVLCHAAAAILPAGRMAGLWTDSRLINLKVQSQCEGWEGAGGLSKSPAVCGAKVKYANVQILKAWQMVKMSPCSHSYSVVDSWSGRRCSCWCFSVAR